MRALEDELKGVDDPLSLQFRVYTSKNDNIFSSRNKYGAWKEPVPGFNFHAEILEEMVKVITRDVEIDNPMLGSLMVNLEFFKSTCRVCLLSSRSSRKAENRP